MGGCCSGSRSVAEIEHARREEYRRTHINIGRHAPQKKRTSPRAFYGEYNCPFCGRFWTSTLSRPNTYQICWRCNRNVYPKNLRAVRGSDFKCEEGTHSFIGTSQGYNVIILEQMASGQPNVSTENFVVNENIKYTNKSNMYLPTRYNNRSLKY